MSKLDFVFFGTPDVASETLEILKEAGYLPTLIVTAPDKPQGRKMLLTPPRVKVWAEKNRIQFIQPASTAELLSYFLSDALVNARGSEKNSSRVKPDLFIVVAYGKILPENLLNIPLHGSINIHYSLLPKYRGASPVESAILSGDIVTGVTIQKMEYKMDAGAIMAQEVLEIGGSETAPELRTRLIKLGGELLVKTLPLIIEGKVTLTPQNEAEATFCTKIKKEDGLINLNDDPTKNYNKFRAYTKWPRTFFFKDGKRIIITQAHLENDKFIIEKIIPEGGKEVAYKMY